jgi:hypothetical protein
MFQKSIYLVFSTQRAFRIVSDKLQSLAKQNEGEYQRISESLLSLRLNSRPLYHCNNSQWVKILINTGRLHFKFKSV